MEVEVPHILSNPVEKFVTERSAHAIFSVRSFPRGWKFASDRIAQKEYLKLMKRVMSKEDRGTSLNWSTMDKKLANSTGFVFDKPNNVLHILTAAHLIQEAYRDSSPLDNTHICALNRAYYFDVACIHKGRDFQSNGQCAKQDMDESYLPAVVVAISSALDLMLLQVDHEQLGLTCTADHNTITGIADSAPPRGELVLLQGWPENKCDTSLWGNVSVMREYKWLTQMNPLGYKMGLIELPGLVCEAGCSGGPLVDGRLKCVGVCHANLNGSCYAVSVQHIRNFLSSVDLRVDLGANRGLAPGATAPATSGAAPAAAASSKKGHDNSKAEHDAPKSKGLQLGQDNNIHEDGTRRIIRKRKKTTEVEKDEKDQEEDDEENTDGDDDWDPKEHKKNARGR